MKSYHFCLLLLVALVSSVAHAQDTNQAKQAPPAPPKMPQLPPPPAIPLFDGKTLTRWKETNFGGSGGVIVTNGEIQIEMGTELSGITFTNKIPTQNYEIALEAMKRAGNDFFCGLTFPVGTNHCSLIVGGWGGSVVGISSIDGMDASENETTKYRSFDKNKWYKIRVRVTPEKIFAWIDDEKLIDVEIKGRKVSMRFGEIEESIPLGIATFQTSSSIRNIKLSTVR